MTKPSESGFDFYGVTNEEEVFATLTRAADLGVTFWDTSDFYGDSKHLTPHSPSEAPRSPVTHSGEVSIGKWFAKTGRRNEIFLATKFGFTDKNSRIDGTPEYVKKAIASSLKRLGLDYVDLYYLHRCVIPTAHAQGLVAHIHSPVPTRTRPLRRLWVH